MVWLKSQTYDLYTVFLSSRGNESASHLSHLLRFHRHISTGEPTMSSCVTEAGHN